MGCLHILDEAAQVWTLPLLHVLHFPETAKLATPHMATSLDLLTGIPSCNGGSSSDMQCCEQQK